MSRHNLVQQTKHILLQYICNSTDDLLRDICNDIQNNPDWIVNSALDGIQRARQPGYAFISDHILLEVMNRNTLTSLDNHQITYSTLLPIINHAT